MRTDLGGVLRTVAVAILVVSGSSAGAVTVTADSEHISTLANGVTRENAPCIDPCLAVNDAGWNGAASRLILSLTSSGGPSPINFAPVPLPASLPLLLVGLGGLGVIGWRRRKKQ